MLGNNFFFNINEKAALQKKLNCFGRLWMEDDEYRARAILEIADKAVFVFHAMKQGFAKAAEKKGQTKLFCTFCLLKHEFAIIC